MIKMLKDGGKVRLREGYMDIPSLNSDYLSSKWVDHKDVMLSPDEVYVVDKVMGDALTLRDYHEKYFLRDKLCFNIKQFEVAGDD